MVDVKHKRCKEIGCNKQPSYNIEGESNRLYCKNHANKGMVDVTNKRCKGQNGECDTRANRKYKGYCAFCFQHTFPKDSFHSLSLIPYSLLIL